MARSGQPQSKRRNTSTNKSNKSNKRRLSSSAPESGFLDYEAKRSILGIAIIVFAIILLVASILPSNAVVTSFVSHALHLTFGVGCYVFPLFMAAIGLSFMIQWEREHVSSRAALGLLLIFIAILTILSLFSPKTSIYGAQAVFLEENIVALGGYVGGGLAWVGLTLFGQVIAVIIAVGVIVASFFIIGFSLSEFKNKVEQKRAAHQQKKEEESVLPAAALAGNKNMSTAGNTQVLSSVNAFQPAAVPAEKKAYRPATSLIGKGSSAKGLSGNGLSLYEKKKAEGWVDPTIADMENEKNAAAKTRVLRKSAAADATATTESSGALDSTDVKPLTRKLGQKTQKEESGTASTAQTAKKTPAKKKSRQDDSLAIPAPLEGFELPSPELLRRSQAKANSSASEEELAETAEILSETLEDFGISIEVKGWVAGPTVTLFKIALPSGVRVNRITVLSDDIALALAAPGVRIFAPIPGTNYVGIEVPNKVRQTVLLGDVLDSAPKGPLQCAVGKDVEGNNVVMDLAKAPHVLIGGTTGSGKSVGINSFIMSMLMRNTPNEVRMILIDPKRVEFSLYNGIPHLYIPVVEDPKDASAALNWGVAEMERRLKLFSSVGARNIAQFNTKVQSGELENENALPFIVIVIDELADLMMNVGKEVEFSISRLAQLARAAGIHLIVATQRPSTNVVTGLIKSNITTRIAFTVASGIDSRVILDSTGAENLTNNGDLLFSKPDLAKPLRIQGCYVSEDEINDVVEHLKQQGDPDYHSEILQVNTMSLGDTAPDGSGGRGGVDDPLLWEAAEIVVSAGTASTSYIQRRLSVGYSRAGRIMDMLESKGVVGPQNGSKAREVLVDALELETLKAFELND